MKNLKQLFLEQLKQGVSPDLLARSIGYGATIGVIPILGVTTWLCLLVAVRLKLNHAAIQITHHVLYPLQLLLVIPYWKAGEWLFRKADPINLNVKEIIRQLEENFVDTFIHYGKTALMGGVVWILTAPVIYIVFYSIAKKILSYKSSYRY